MQFKTRPILILLLCFSLLLMTNQTESDAMDDGQKISTDIYKETLTIESNDDLVSKARENNWDADGSWDGSADRPFMVEDLEFYGVSGSAIEIKNTDLHVIFYNITIGGHNITHTGVYFENVRNAKLQSSHIYDLANDSLAVSIVSCHNVRVITTTFEANGIWAENKQGIYISNSEHIIVISNYMYQLNNPIMVFSSHRVRVEHNSLDNNVNIDIYLLQSTRTAVTRNYVTNGGAGIYMQGSNNSYVHRNTITAGYNRGIVLTAGSFWSNIHSNIISDMGYYGIHLQYAEYNRIHSNNVSTSDAGIYAEIGSANNEIKWNNFVNNQLTPSQLYDGGIYNDIAYNYYNENTTDLDLDSFVDHPYDINGGTNTDPHPLANAHLWSTLQVLSPSFRQVVDRNLTISWSTIDSNYINADFYRVYYRKQDDSSTVLLNASVTTTSVNWVIPDLAYGEYYIIINAIYNDTLNMGLSSSLFWIKNHELSTFNVIYPNGGEELNGTHPIQWEAAVDSMGYEVEYSVYYSTDVGATWTKIGTTIYTQYSYNFGQLTAGLLYLVKVVASNGYGLIVADTSDSVFTVVQATTTVPSTPSTSSSTTSGSSGTITTTESTTTSSDPTESSSSSITDSETETSSQTSDDSVVTPTVEFNAIAWSAVIASFSCLLLVRRQNLR